jgi:hypothetical protein
MLSAESFETRKRLLILFLAKPREKAKAILKTYELFVSSDIHLILTHFVKYAKMSDNLA